MSLPPSHSALPELTKSAIYIIRNPFDVCKSLSEFDQKSTSLVAKAMVNKDYLAAGEFDELIYGIELRSRWDVHFRSWMEADFPVLLVKYEDLVKNTSQEIKRILDFLSLESNSSLIDELVVQTNLKNLQKQENQKGFQEAGVGNRFFHSGRMNSRTSGFIKNLFTTEFSSTLKELGYVK